MTDETALTRAPTQAIEQPQQQVGIVAAIAREDSEIKASMLMARSMPRSEEAALQKLMRACERASFAEGAVYRFPRGGTQIDGPSVELAREAARCWGNIRYGMRVVSKDEDWIHVKGYAFDLESNVYMEIEDRFRRLIQRKGKGWVEPDERDERELTNRRGAICERNAILKVLPKDLIEDAQRRADATMEAVSKKELGESREDAIKRTVASFDKIGVTVEMLEKRLRHPLGICTVEELVEIRKIGASIRDGNSKREEYFELPEPVGERKKETLDSLLKDGK